MAAKNNTALWNSMGFTTTAEERIGPGPPYTSPALQANLFFRVFLSFISFFVALIPARLLWRNGEFAGTIFCVMLLIFNVITIVNALIWRDNNVENWWAGYGWCDIQVYTFFALHTAFNVSMFEIQRGLASRVALRRADKPTRNEIRRGRIVSAAVIFTFPVIQVVLTYFSTISRYNISTLVGCGAVYYPNWIYLVFYIIPTPFFAVLAAITAAVGFVRYRRIEKVTRDVAHSQDGVSAARHDRLRVKLYFTTLVCIIVVLPLVMILLFRNIVEGAPWNLPYDFDALHFGPDPYNVYFISFTTSDRLSFPAMNIAYIGTVAGIFVSIPFGTTPEAINMYRGMLLALGLGYLFPKLRNECVPGPKRTSKFGWGSTRGKSLLGSNSTASTRKDSLLPTAEQVSLASRADRACSSSMNQPQPRDFTMGGDGLQYPETTMATASTHPNPWPDLSATELDMATVQIEAGPPPPSRNPYTILPTPIAKPPPKFPSISIPSLHSPQKTHPHPHQPAVVTTTLPSDTSIPSLTSSSLASRPGLSNAYPVSASGSAAQSTNNLQPSSRQDSTNAIFPPTTTTTTTSSSSSSSSTTTTPWSATPHGAMVGVVDTRVWASTSNPPSPTRDSRPPHVGGVNSPATSDAGIERTGGGGGVVRVETHIARRSMEVGQGDVEEQGRKRYEVRVARSSNAAS